MIFKYTLTIFDCDDTIQVLTQTANGPQNIVYQGTTLNTEIDLYEVQMERPGSDVTYSVIIIGLNIRDTPFHFSYGIKKYIMNDQRIVRSSAQTDYFSYSSDGHNNTDPSPADASNPYIVFTNRYFWNDLRQQAISHLYFNCNKCKDEMDLAQNETADAIIWGGASYYNFNGNGDVDERVDIIQHSMGEMEFLGAGHGTQSPNGYFSDSWTEYSFSLSNVSNLGEFTYRSFETAYQHTERVPLFIKCTEV